MVFVWSQLTRGDPTYTLVQVSVNDIIMVFAFAPIVAILLGITDLVVPWETLLLSVGLYVVIPLLAGMATALLVGGTLAAAEASTRHAFPRHLDWWKLWRYRGTREVASQVGGGYAVAIS
jgi:ACR3 family arsenite efflux pump ArsB